MSVMASSGTEQNVSAAGSNVPAFVAKLWSLVDDEATNELISWGADGRSFHLYDHFRFAKEILPLFFKHSNLSSFIRQLNMYGFRKVLNIEQGGLKVERDDMEFQHHFFIQGQPELLPHIKRKVTQPNSNNPQPNNSTQVALMQQDALIERANMEEKVDNLEMSLKVLQATQDVVNEQLVQIKRENGTLWQELSLQRQKHLKQQQITHKLLQFIMHSVLPSSSSSSSSGAGSSRQRGSISLGGKRKFPPLMIDQPPKRAATSDGLTHSASIDNALEAIEDVFAASPDVVPSGPIIREIPLEVYEASVAAASSSTASSSSSNGQTLITAGRSTPHQHVPNVTSTVTQPTFATAVAEDGSTVLLMQTGTGAGLRTGNGEALTSQVPFVTALPSLPQQQPRTKQPSQLQQRQPQQVFKYELAPMTATTTTVPIITPADSPAEVRQAPSPAYSIHSVPSPASVAAASPKPANAPAPVVTSAPSTTEVIVDPKPISSNGKRSARGGKHGNKNLPLLNTSTITNSNAAASAYNKAGAGSGSTPEIIDTPTLTDFISQFPIMQPSEGGSTATTTIRSKSGASVKTDTLGAAVMLSGVNADEHDLEDDDDAATAESEAAAAGDENRLHDSTHSAPSPRGLARSLSRKIDTVDAGLEGIKDMLTSQSPDLNMDPTDLLNLFMPEGPITTDPRTPIALDDFLEGGVSPFNWPNVATSKALQPPPGQKKIDLSTPPKMEPK